MNKTDLQYKDLLNKILEEGSDRSDRTGVGTRSIFGHQMSFDLSEGFPLLTTKRVPFGLIVSELNWFLKGDTNIRYLLENDNNIWNEWAFEKWIKSEDYQGPDMTDFGRRAAADEAFRAVYQQEMEAFKQRVLSDDDFANQYGDLGPVYGKQWRDWNGCVDQIKNVIQSLKDSPNSRRHIVSGWNPELVDDMALPPCHTMFQFHVSNGKLSCQLYQRSADVFLGVPFNIASYALLTALMAKEVGLEPGKFVHTIGDAHIYSNHFPQVRELLSREPRSLPTLDLSGIESVFDLTVEASIKNHVLQNYIPHPPIKAPIAV